MPCGSEAEIPLPGQIKPSVPFQIQEKAIFTFPIIDEIASEPFSNPLASRHCLLPGDFHPIQLAITRNRRCPPAFRQTAACGCVCPAGGVVDARFGTAPEPAGFIVLGYARVCFGRAIWDER